MTVVFHPAVQSDFNQALDYYEAAGLNLAERFESEFRKAMAAIAANPRQFQFYMRSRIFRRVRLPSFPYVAVYREQAFGVRVLVLKSEKRRPRFGLSRR
ncbi:MAG: type II toxin-antitoxin system RelE/ParE family toxin [Opitutaceae bacterium]|nr:type II toxin-antitoxin system RelE/ParE family toxin [Opitutaceae bacterium]